MENTLYFSLNLFDMKLGYSDRISVKKNIIEYLCTHRGIKWIFSYIGFTQDEYANFTPDGIYIFDNELALMFKLKFSEYIL